MASFSVMPASFEDGQKYGFYADELVAQLLRKVHRALQDGVGVVAQVRLSALHLGQMGYLLLQGRVDGIGIHAQLLEHEGDHFLAFVDDAGQQVDGLYALLPVLLRNVHRCLYGFLRLDREFVECHFCFSFLI